MSAQSKSEVHVKGMNKPQTNYGHVPHASIALVIACFLDSSFYYGL